MSQHDERRPQRGGPDPATDDALTRDEARFVARLAEAYAPPEPTPADRVRFQARLEERLARADRRAPWRWLVPATLALAAVAIVSTQLRVGDVATTPPLATTTPLATTARLDDAALASEGETLLALVIGNGANDESALPEDYQAIASLMY